MQPCGKPPGEKPHLTPSYGKSARGQNHDSNQYINLSNKASLLAALMTFVNKSLRFV